MTVDNLISITRLFADDTSLLHSLKRLNDIERCLNSDLEKVHDWSTKWMVSFNPLKTDVLLISNRQTDVLKLKFGDTNLQITDTHTHLGITFSYDGKWSKHINNICESASTKLNVLRKLKYILSRNSLDKIYNTFILPILEYACEVWDGCNAEDKDRLEKIHRYAARIITGLPLYASIESLYIETGWLSLSDRREQRKLNLFYKIHNGIAPSYVQELIPHQLHQTSQYNLRRNDNYTIPF